MLARAHRALMIVGGLLLASCGGEPVAPKISDLRLSPRMARPSDVLSILVDFEDADGDLAGGSAELSLWDEAAPEGQLFEVSISGNSTAEKGAIALTLRVPPTEAAGPHQLSVTVIDASERRSAPLVTDLVVLAP